MHSKGNCKENKKKTHRMGENICKWSNQQGNYVQNIEVARAVPYQKNKQPNKTMGGRSKYILPQRRHTESQETRENMFKITND